MPPKYTHCADCGKEKTVYWQQRYALCVSCSNQRQKDNATKTKYAACIDCGKPKNKPNYNPRCRSCSKQKTPRYDSCIDCGKPKTTRQQRRGPRCGPCDKKSRGPTKHIHYTHCIDCGEEKSRNPYPRCKPCSKKELWKDPEFQAKQEACHSDPEFIRKQSESKLELWSDPEFHAEHASRLAERNRAAAYPCREGRYALDFNDDLKEAIRERDGRKCQLCGKAESECDKRLHVHHIDYDKLNSAPTNLIALCNPCHLKTNWNRPYWIQVFTKYRGRALKQDWQRKVVVSAERGLLVAV